MKITVELRLTDVEENQLAHIVQCSREELGAKMTGYAEAAAMEYVRMFLGQKVFTRGTDYREYRLVLLIKHAFGDRIPSQQTICNLFQTTTAQARSLVRSVTSRFQYDLHSAMEMTARDVLGKATRNNDEADWLVTIDNEAIVGQLNRKLAHIRGRLPPISRKQNTLSEYVIPRSSCEELKKSFGLEGEKNDA